MNKRLSPCTMYDTHLHEKFAARPCCMLFKCCADLGPGGRLPLKSCLGPFCRTLGTTRSTLASLVSATPLSLATDLSPWACPLSFLRVSMCVMARRLEVKRSEGAPSARLLDRARHFKRTAEDLQRKARRPSAIFC